MNYRLYAARRAQICIGVAGPLPGPTRRGSALSAVRAPLRVAPLRTFGNGINCAHCVRRAAARLFIPMPAGSFMAEN